MNSPAAITMRVQLDDCWNRIGVRGDLSCPRLREYVHCRNCPVHASAAATLLDVPLPSDHLARWTKQLAQVPAPQQTDSLSLVLFCIGSEALALPTVVFDEIADLRPIHSLPQRRGGLILGVCNVRGELRVCISLHHLLGISGAPVLSRKELADEARLLVVQNAGSRAVIPVDRVLGIFRFSKQLLQAVPATVARATATYSRALLQWQQTPVGVLDEQLLFRNIDRNLQSSTST